MSTDVCGYCKSPEVTARKVLPGGFTIAVCDPCIGEDRDEHDHNPSDEPSDDDDSEDA